MSTKPRTFAIIGLGTFGGTVATDLSDLGDHVIGIDIDESVVDRFADKMAQALIADGRDEQALREAGVDQCDVVIVAIGEDLEANILCAMNARLVGVGKVWVKAMTRTHHRILSKLGVDRVIHAEREMGQRIAQVLHNPLVRDYVSVGNGFHVVNIVVPETMSGVALSSLKLRDMFDLRCLGVMRGTETITDDGADPELKTDDRLLVLGRRNDLRHFSDSL